jgi:nitroimidazol reductase NimA-like FMN-containing flavoprotein (pyridoxamine 5'-phosphate oxidase superfamily)
MRRNDREVTDRQEILKIMRKCDVCRLALNDDGFPYVIPLNFGLIDNGETVELIFHSALEGHKIDIMKADNRAAFEMDCSHQLQYFEERGYCTFSYESVMGYGHITILEDTEKEEALRAIMRQYHPGENAYFNPAAIPRTLVYKLTVEKMTGKRKELKK